MAVEYDIVIIGGGSGGLVVASAASQLKAKVALVEKERLGGDCLWFGCVPSKSLIHASRIAYNVRHSHHFGVYTSEIKINFSEAIAHVQEVISQIEPHDSPERFRNLGVEVIFGDGQFIDKNTFEVNGQKLTARAFVVATGSRAAIPDLEGLDEAGYLTNEQVFSLTEVPKSLAVIGAGPIGCELGQALSRLGVEVTIIDSGNQILPKEEAETAEIIEKQLISEGIKIIKQTKAEKIALKEGKKYLLLNNKETLIVDEILLAAGRSPNIENLGLENAGIETTKKGIKVNQKLQTTNPKIYACGDVIGGYQFTHIAGYEATVVIQNALFFPSKKADYRVIPWATFTDPEIARVGLSEREAREIYGDNLVILQQDFANVDRAQTEGKTAGFAKIITTKKGAILGAHLVGTTAGDLIHEIVLAMNNNLKVTTLTGIHIYPTLAEINSKTALQFTKQNYAKNLTLQNILQKLFNFLRNIN
jgi:pyruvate/2-oxoglutarate dehydrogenase complex dihydrolipoamide dehydrogenase (E3) component